MHWLPTGECLRGADRRRWSVPVKPAGGQILIHPRLHVGVAVAREDRDAGALSRGVGDDLVPLKQESKIDDSQHHQQERREHERKFDELCTTLTRPEASARLAARNSRLGACA